jgi:hypothetical protein
VLTSPVPTIDEIGRDDRGDFANFQSDFGNMLIAFLLGKLVNFLDDMESNT